MNWLYFLEKVYKVVLLFLSKYRALPPHKRKEGLVDLGEAIDKAMKDGDIYDTRGIEEWFKR